MQVDQIPVAADEEVRLAVHRDLQELVVPRVPAGANAVQDRHHLDDPPEQQEKLLPLLDRHIGIELRAGQHVGQLAHRRLRDQQRALVHGAPHRLAGHRRRS